MNVFNQIFGNRIFVINRATRTARREHAQQELGKLGITQYSIFTAHEPVTMINGLPDGNHACTSSHRALLDACAVCCWHNMLVLEDDFCLLPDLDYGALLSAAFAEIDRDWDMLYLGGGYGSDPQYRHSEHLIRVNTMMTTSSYAISGDFAAKLAPYIFGHGPIDSLYHGHTPQARAYCITPRLFAQYTSMSDLTGRETDYVPSMTDTRHEEMLLQGEWTGPWQFVGPILRREIAGRQDLNGSTVIIKTGRYTVLGIEFPDHLPPWRKGEMVTYHVTPAPSCSSPS